MDEIKLKPCPFCGSEEIAIIKEETQKDVLEINDNTPQFVSIDNKYQVFCDHCSCQTAKYSYLEVAVESWNRRANDG